MARSFEKAYNHLLVNDAMKLLMFKNYN